MTHHRRYWALEAVLLATILGSLALTPWAWAQSHYKILHVFHKGGSGGYTPIGGLIMDQAGNLYGTTTRVGADYLGNVFELTPAANGKWTEKVLHHFTGGNDGRGPTASLIFDQAGNLYGTTGGGGANNSGTVFQLTPNSDGTWTESILYAFCSLNKCADGAEPLDNVIFDHVGNLYGTTAAGGSTGCNVGCGTVFKLTPHSDGTWTENVLYSFCSQKGCRDGGEPSFDGVIFDQVGNLYGTTGRGGIGCSGFGCGVAFRLAPNADGTWTENVLHDFCSRSACSDGGAPGNLIMDQSGNLYGTAGAGNLGAGVVFQLTPQADGSWKERVLHNFRGGDGRDPSGPLIFDQTGNLYGTTFEGGRGSAGVVFKLTPNSNGGWHETVLHTFQDHPGAILPAGVILDALGNLYGTTEGDNNTTFGSVFEITP